MRFPSLNLFRSSVRGTELAIAAAFGDEEYDDCLREIRKLFPSKPAHRQENSRTPIETRAMYSLLNNIRHIIPEAQELGSFDDLKSATRIQVPAIFSISLIRRGNKHAAETPFMIGAALVGAKRQAELPFAQLLSGACVGRLAFDKLEDAARDDIHRMQIRYYMGEAYISKRDWKAAADKFAQIKRCRSEYAELFLAEKRINSLSRKLNDYQCD
jgi:hypothetical protein